TAAMAWAVPAGESEPARAATAWLSEVRPLARGIAGYFLFGVGYIAYMTFIVSLLREQGLGTGVIVAFYALLGVGVIVSPWLWAALLQRERGGGALARLNALLGLAVILPVLWSHAAVAFVSGAIFGGVFLSVVASTTAMVRHNLPPERWTAGIAAFTVIFAFGQIIGPAVIGWVSDELGGLRPGLGMSAGLLLLGAVVAWMQPPLVPPSSPQGPR
ncbi:MAG: YbfB/YjiJ family MFS transporter, partial [Betaproteobacteria bacterium]|nr:YbfB/YjiJ family MFS transporter [Betaproteobacteria bacterium]